MSIKKKLLRAVKDLKKHLGEDEETNNALEHLMSKVDGIEEEVEELIASDMPLPKEIKEKSFALFSDGACRGNPGPGAWGCMVQNENGDLIISDSDVDEQTTNNKMELLGGIRAIELLDDFLENNNDSIKDYNLFLYTDSKYMVDGINKWVPGWKARHWKKADKKTPENLELWQRLDYLNDTNNIQFIWVKGHAGHPQNEFCDSLANKALDNEGY
jgi:ribonuclease HI